jgi:N-acetylglucosamine-6-sulfatase
MRRRRRVALAVAALGAAIAFPGTTPGVLRDARPNVVLILTDDQSIDSFPSTPPAMPWLQAHVFDPSDHWLWFPNAVDSTPLCCPSRATILSGEYSHHTGVLDNTLGDRFDETDALPVWLHQAGYHTGLVGKYLNEYPFDRPPYVPPGWDRWFAKLNPSGAATYYGYPIIDQAERVEFSDAPTDYATDVLADQAVEFVRDAPEGRPFFLEFTPSAPHGPIQAPPRYVGAFAGVDIPRAPSFAEQDVSDKPSWVRALHQIKPPDAEQIAVARQRESEALLAVDDAVQRIVEEVAARGDLARTVIVFLTDNGFSFGEHRHLGKTCPYEECVHTPLAIRVPWLPSATIPFLASNVDLAPTIAALAGLPPRPSDGLDLRRIFDPRFGPPPPREGALIEYLGGGEVPPWHGVRTLDFTYVEYVDGEQELYDRAGEIGPADPDELENRVSDPAYAAQRRSLASLLHALLAE